MVALSDLVADLRARIVLRRILEAERMGAIAELQAQLVGLVHARFPATVTVVRRAAGAVGKVLEVLLCEAASLRGESEHGG